MLRYRSGALAALVFCTAGACAAPDGAAGADQADPARGWAALRAMDCARCHGRDYGGWSAPSLLAAVHDGTRERFDQYVLEGDPTRGMPGYRSQPLVVAELDAIYAYLRARTEGRTSSVASPSQASR
jgi:mono/diheme cytochrome c family protein